MLIYSEQITPRLRYAVQNGLDGYNGEIEFTSDLDNFQTFNGPKIAYTKTPFEKQDAIHIWPSGILEYNDFHRIKVPTGRWKNLPIIFVSSEGIKFDFFSAVFFALTRYEEYWKYEGDDMGRYTPDLSIFNSLEVLDRPMAFHLIRKKKG